MREQIESLVREALRNAEKPASSNRMTIPIAVSNRHVHLSEEHIKRLFGRGLKEKKPLSQPGQFAAEETVTLIGPKGKIPGVRVLGPARSSSQVEVSRTDAFQLGVDAPLRLSGNTEGTPGIKLQGPRGQVEIKEGVIVAACHIHMHPEDASRFGVADQDRVTIRSTSSRPVSFHDTVIRVSDKFRLEMHVDFDEANAAFLTAGAEGVLIRP
ncbi:phosphate propanoyltransferase [Alkalicoccus urumqiensis]|uniref:Phosphate propanoyltransferase n=1 Tax=Alkalicoccus urumqiensis TaxID=1548213 RepID=A0A2P6MIY7_ALKUR|nr:phosphate propanoyltransferase [Alkalicoccus urumqiensis]PRO66213.1 propanediol utilization protein [Alkalicoccus urumqiensis]